MTTNNHRGFDSEKHVVLTYIDQWENHSIAKIRLNAEQMRNEIEEILVKRRQNFLNLLNQINTTIETNSDGLNQHLNHWMTQLTQCQVEFLNFSSSIRLEQDTKNTPVCLLRLSYKGKITESIHQFKNENCIDVPGTKTLTRSMLRDASPTKRKQMLGERLFLLVQQIEPTLAAKITGMFLEWDTKYILMLFTSSDILTMKIKEAKNILQAYAHKQRYVSQS